MGAEEIQALSLRRFETREACPLAPHWHPVAPGGRGYLPESFAFLEANRNAVATGLIALGTLADVALAFLLLVWALKHDKFSVSVFSSVAFAAYAGVHVWASYVFVTLIILD